jgi:hypothetical protein
MKKKETGESEINNILLREALKGNPFLVPEDYFSTLKKEIILKKNISMLGESSFIVPQNYQKNLSQDILSKISEERLKEFIPTHKPSLPIAYFDDLQKRILSKTIKADEDDTIFPKKESIVKPIKRLGVRKWISYVAAASITIAIGLFAILEGVKLTTDQNSNYNTQINKVPTDEIIGYLAYYSEPGDLQYLSEQLNDVSVNFTEDLSSQEIEAYLEYGL